MRTNALSVANYFVDLADKEHAELRPLKLMKLVYMAYGYALAMLDRSIIDPRFDRVEAWRFGPVIPSVYHSFKQYGKEPVTAKTTIIESDGVSMEVVTPTLNDRDIERVCNIVWNRYSPHSDGELVRILHGKATPWGRVYEEGMNRVIPETLTKDYYVRLIERLRQIDNG